MSRLKAIQHLIGEVDLDEDSWFDHKLADIMEGYQNEGVVIDVRGRIFLDGQHVGWIEKSAPFQSLNLFANILDTELPILSDISKLEENPDAA